MNRWHIYNELKQNYLQNGSRISRNQALARYKGRTSKREINEGYTEFSILCQRFDNVF